MPGGFAGSGAGVNGQCWLVAIVQLPNYPQTRLLSLGKVEFPCHTIYEEPQEPGLLCSILGVAEFIF